MLSLLLVDDASPVPILISTSPICRIRNIRRPCFWFVLAFVISVSMSHEPGSAGQDSTSCCGVHTSASLQLSSSVGLRWASAKKKKKRKRNTNFHITIPTTVVLGTPGSSSQRKVCAHCRKRVPCKTLEGADRFGFPMSSLRVGVLSWTGPPGAPLTCDIASPMSYPVQALGWVLFQSVGCLSRAS